MKYLFVYWTLLISFLFSQNIHARSDTQQLKELAEKYSTTYLNMYQPFAYFDDIELLRHDKFIKNSSESFESYAQTEDQILIALNKLDVSKIESDNAKVFYEKFIENIETSVDKRVCKSELWSVSHMFGPHTLLDSLVNIQPIETEQDKKDALARWDEAAVFYQQEIVNLTNGLKQGYSAPKRVVGRLLTQLNGLLSIAIDDHPYLKLAKRADDPAFEKSFKHLLEHKLLPAIKNYTHFLGSVYLKGARDELGLHALPNGRACYVAMYRSYTSLKRSPEEVYKLGTETVNGYKSEVLALGKSIYNVDSFAAAVKKASTDPNQKFADAKAMHQFFESVVTRSKETMKNYFHKLPSIELKIETIPDYQQGTGRSAHYVPGNNERPAKFAYDPTNFTNENFASAEIVSVHEGYPGHHVQIALVQAREKFHPIEGTFWNAAYSEGWARYAEALSEEADVYQYDSTKILRRAWPARGMVADTAMHLLGWSNEEVADFLVESGASFTDDPSTLLDRMAALPAQLTAYDSGALEIFAMRKLMESELGQDFDIKDFHQIILSNGGVPMAVLNKQIRVYIVNKQALYQHGK